MTLLGLRLGNVQYGPAGHLNRNLRFQLLNKGWNRNFLNVVFIRLWLLQYIYRGLYAGNAEISDTANLLIFEACLAVVDEYVYGAVSENLSVPAMWYVTGSDSFALNSYFFAVRLTAVLRTGCQA